MRVDADADTDQTARRVLREKLGFEPAHLEQACTESGPARDPRGWSASVVYLALHAADALQPLADDGRITLHDIEALPALAFDHNRLIALAAQRCARSRPIRPSSRICCTTNSPFPRSGGLRGRDRASHECRQLPPQDPGNGRAQETRIVPAAYRPAQAYRLAEPLTDFGQNLAR